jgi:hypothetical protein
VQPIASCAIIERLFLGTTHALTVCADAKKTVSCCSQ